MRPASQLTIHQENGGLRANQASLGSDSVLRRILTLSLVALVGILGLMVWIKLSMLEGRGLAK